MFLDGTVDGCKRITDVLSDTAIAMGHKFSQYILGIFTFWKISDSLEDIVFLDPVVFEEFVERLGTEIIFESDGGRTFYLALGEEELCAAVGCEFVAEWCWKTVSFEQGIC